MPPDDLSPALPALAEKVAFLSALPGIEEVIETHMAFVFLTADHALKLKKPVQLGQSDCRTLAARERAVAKEIWLNRDLAPAIYLGRLALWRADHGLSLDRGDRVVDWLVHMKRLPQDRMLDRMIRRGHLPDDAQLGRLAQTLVAFFRRQARRHRPRHLYPLHLSREMAVNVAHLRQMAACLPRPASLAILDQTDRALHELHAEILFRDRSGMVIEGHGDLKPEHLCMTDPPVIFDRAEAALELRVIDIWDESLGLATECAMMGYPRLAGLLCDALVAAGMPPPSPRLLVTYVQFRLVTRARLALDHLRDPAPSTRADWPRKAQRYLDAALALSAPQTSALPPWWPARPDPASR